MVHAEDPNLFYLDSLRGRCMFCQVKGFQLFYYCIKYSHGVKNTEKGMLNAESYIDKKIPVRI